MGHPLESSIRQTFGSAFVGEEMARRAGSFVVAINEDGVPRASKLFLAKTCVKRSGNDRKHRPLDWNTCPNKKRFDNEISGFQRRTCPRGDAGAGAIDRRKTGVNS